MPYKSNSDLPKTVQDYLLKYGQDIYREAFNYAYEEYKDANKRRKPSDTREFVSYSVAWSAVEKKY